MPSAFNIPPQVLYTINCTVYGVNILIASLVYAHFSHSTPFGGQYVLAAIVGGFVIGSLMHLRIFKNLIAGGRVDMTLFVIALLLVPLYPSSIILYGLYSYAFNEKFAFNPTRI